MVSQELPLGLSILSLRLVPVSCTLSLLAVKNGKLSAFLLRKTGIKLTMATGYANPPLETRFKPGNPGGPGRPRKRQISEAYEEWLSEPLSPERIVKLRAEGIKMKPGATNADVVALAQGNQAIRGNVNAAKEMREATEGKATQRVELSRGEDANAPDQLVVVYATPVPGERELPAESAAANNQPVIDLKPEEAQAVIDVIAKASEDE